MRRNVHALIVFAAALAVLPATVAAHGHGGGGSGGHAHAGMQGGSRMSPGGLRPGRSGMPIGPQFRDGHGRGFSHPGHFVHGGFGTGWWVVAGAWYPWYPAAEAVVPAVAEAAYYCPSVAAYFPTVQVCPEGWVLVMPPAPLPY